MTLLDSCWALVEDFQIFLFVLRCPKVSNFSF
nr:MAG TPA: hypothetical protein [Bacteriophage sp.]